MANKHYTQLYNTVEHDHKNLSFHGEENKIETYRRPARSMSPIARTMHGSISKHVTPLARMEADSPSIPMFASRSPAPDCIRI